MPAAYFVGAGWANKCANQLITVGWVQCIPDVLIEPPVESVSHTGGSPIGIQKQYITAQVDTLDNSEYIQQLLQDDDEILRIIIAAIDSGVI